MRGLMLWVSGAVLAFAATAGSFLLLANVADAPQERRLEPPAGSAERGPALLIEVEEARLDDLERAPGQTIDLRLLNRGTRDLSAVSVVLEVSSENTSVSDVRQYKATVDELAAGESASVGFEVNLSPSLPESPDPSRKIVEIRATTPEGASAVRTVILPL